MEQNFNPTIMYESDDEEDETLSLCDLPIYGEPDNYSLEDQNSSSSSSDGQLQLVDQFEFFTQEWIATTTSYNPADNILFCGKLIPYKQNVDNSFKLRSNKQRKRTKHVVLKWNLKSKTSKSEGRKGKCIDKNASSLPYSSSFNSLHSSKQRISRHGSCDNKNDILGHGRITIFKSLTKSKWFLFFFGMARAPTTEMEMREVRKRQNKKSRSLRSSGGGGGKKSGKGNRKGWWKLIRALACSGYHHADAVIKASYGCAPLIRPNYSSP